MAGVNIGNAGVTFVDQIVNDVVETLNNESGMRQYVKTETNWNGDYREGRVHVKRSGAIQYTEDGGAFPIAGNQAYVPYKTYRKFLAASIQLTDGALAAAKAGKNVARDVLQSETEGMMQDIMKMENGFFFRDGSGKVCDVTETLATGAQTTQGVSDARMLWEDVEYDVYNGSTYLGTTSVDLNDGSLNASGDPQAGFTSSLSASATVASGGALYWKNSYGRAINGLDKLIGDAATTFQGVDVSAYPHYSSLVLDSSTSRALTPRLFRDVFAGLRQKTGNVKPSNGLKVLTSTFQAINLEELYEGELRLTPDTTIAGVAVGAFQSALGRVDLVWNSDALYDTIFFCDFSQIGRAVQKPLSWRRDGGQILKRSDVAGYYTGTAIEIADLFIKERHSSAKLTDLSYSLSTGY
jgi:hypothetical protein